FPLSALGVPGLAVVRLEIRVRDRPARRNTAVVHDFAEVLLAQPDERGAVELGIAAHGVGWAGGELPAILVLRRVGDVVAALADDGVRIPVLLLAPHVVTALEQ